MNDAHKARPLLIDTGAFFARYYERAKEHATAKQVFDGIVAGDLPYRPLYTSQSVLAELATLMNRKATHEDAVRALEQIREAESINVLPIDRGTFDAAAEQFAEYDDQTISFVDHTTAVLARERGIDHVFAFDRDFSTLGLDRVPVDSGDV